MTSTAGWLAPIAPDDAPARLTITLCSGNHLSGIASASGRYCMESCSPAPRPSVSPSMPDGSADAISRRTGRDPPAGSPVEVYR